MRARIGTMRFTSSRTLRVTVRRRALLLVVLVAAAAALLGGGSSWAEVFLYTFNSPNPQPSNGYFGSLMATGDVDGDGRADLVVAAPGEGRVYVFSGNTTHLLYTLAAPNVQALAVGDVNGDGHADIAVGAPPHVYIFSGADGTLVRTIDDPLPPPPSYYDSFGVRLAMGDVDGGGAVDVAVMGGQYPSTVVYFFSGATGVLIRTLNPPAPSTDTFFGEALATGDVDGDSRADIAVMASGTAGGHVYVYSGATGQIIRSIAMSTSSPCCQTVLPSSYPLVMGDVDRDGRADIAWGAYDEQVNGNPQQGTVYVHSGATGAVLYAFADPTPQPYISGLPGMEFGASLSLGDVNADGHADVLVGAPGERIGSFIAEGRAHVYSGMSGTLLFTLLDPHPNFNLGTATPGYSEFGTSTGLAESQR